MELLDQKGNINYAGVIEKYPWIVSRGQKCVLSPDCDGLLCGLLMSALFDWEIVGFYDGKTLLLKNGVAVADCVFLDMEIFRNYVRSLGQHMLLWNKRKPPPNWGNFDNCISPNNIRGFDGKTRFPQKYPLGSIHVLLGITAHVRRIEIRKEAICPLLYVDGTFKNLFNYPENCLGWLEFLCANDDQSPLKTVFFNDHYTTATLMLALKDFFAKLKGIGGGRRGADKIVISSRVAENDDSGDTESITLRNGSFALSEPQHQQAVGFLKLLSDLTGWQFDERKWSFGGFSRYKFTKGTTKPNGKNFDDLLAKNPLSWAMTSSLAIEYTIEAPDKLP
jgi:hypothetical protein